MKKKSFSAFVCHMVIHSSLLGLSTPSAFSGQLWSRPSTSPITTQDQSLIQAAKTGDVDLVSALVDAKADLDQVDKYGDTALGWAIRKDHPEVAEGLIDAGADVNHANVNEERILYFAAEKGLTALTEKLIRAGADVNPANSRGFTALFPVANGGYMGIVEALIAAGIDINHDDNAGETALFAAVRGEKPSVIERLLIAGANVNQINERGHTALVIAIKQGNLQTVQALLSNVKVPYLQDTLDSARGYAVRRRRQDILFVMDRAESERRFQSMRSALVQALPGHPSPQDVLGLIQSYDFLPSLEN